MESCGTAPSPVPAAALSATRALSEGREKQNPRCGEAAPAQLCSLGCTQVIDECSFHVAAMTLPEERARGETQAPLGWQSKERGSFFSFLASLIRRVLEQKKGKCGSPFAVTELPQNNQHSLKSSQEKTGNAGGANWNTLHTPCRSHIVQFHKNVLYFHGQPWPLLVLDGKEQGSADLLKFGFWTGKLLKFPSKEWKVLDGKNLELLYSSGTGQGSREVKKSLKFFHFIPGKWNFWISFLKSRWFQDQKSSEWYKLEAE